MCKQEKIQFVFATALSIAAVLFLMIYSNFSLLGFLASLFIVSGYLRFLGDLSRQYPRD